MVKLVRCNKISNLSSDPKFALRLTSWISTQPTVSPNQDFFMRFKTLGLSLLLLCLAALSSAAGSESREVPAEGNESDAPSSDSRFSQEGVSFNYEQGVAVNIERADALEGPVDIVRVRPVGLADGSVEGSEAITLIDLSENIDVPGDDRDPTKLAVDLFVDYIRGSVRGSERATTEPVERELAGRSFSGRELRLGTGDIDARIQVLATIHRDAPFVVIIRNFGPEELSAPLQAVLDSLALSEE
jgi:hypothetical protein